MDGQLTCSFIYLILISPEYDTTFADRFFVVHKMAHYRLV